MCDASGYDQFYCHQLEELLEELWNNWDASGNPKVVKWTPAFARIREVLDGQART